MVTIKMFAYFMFFYCNKNKIALDFLKEQLQCHVRIVSYKNTILHLQYK